MAGSMEFGSESAHMGDGTAAEPLQLAPDTIAF